MTQRHISPTLAKAELRDLLAAAEEMVLAEWASADVSPDEATPGALSAGSTGLDRITQLGMALIDYEQDKALETVVETLLRIYRYMEGELSVRDISPSSVLKASRWKTVTLRVFSLGAVAVYRSRFSVLRNLVLQVPEPRYKTQYWSRATVTALARGELFQPRSLVPPACDYIAEHPVFFRRFRDNKDNVVDMLCQFDFLQALIIFAETGDYTRSFPSFGAYFKERTEPIIRSVIDGGPPRSVLPKMDDATLAELIATLDYQTARSFFDMAGWDRGWSDPRIEEFLKKHWSSFRYLK